MDKWKYYSTMKLKRLFWSIEEVKEKLGQQDFEKGCCDQLYIGQLLHKRGFDLSNL